MFEIVRRKLTAFPVESYAHDGNRVRRNVRRVGLTKVETVLLPYEICALGRSHLLGPQCAYAAALCRATTR